MSRPEIRAVTARTAPGSLADAARTAGPGYARGPRPLAAALEIPPAGHPGHGATASLRRQPARIVNGRFEGGYADVFEIICPDCGDRPYLDYSEVIPRLQSLRGPYTLEAGLAEYERHLGLAV